MSFTKLKQRSTTLLSWASLLSGCSTHIKCPDSSKTLPVSIVDHGRHASLVIGKNPNEMVRYAFGDWNYYALGDNRIRSGIRALLWPTKAGLGKMTLTGEFSEEIIKQGMREGAEEVYLFNASKKELQALMSELDSIFASAESRHYNRDYDLIFVHHPERYWLFNNSNMMTAEWLRKAGCETRGISLFSEWEVERE